MKHGGFRMVTKLRMQYILLSEACLLAKFEEFVGIKKAALSSRFFIYRVIG